MHTAATPRVLAVAAAIALLLGSGVLPLTLQPGAGFASHTECSDGVDNNHNGRIDYPEDDECDTLDDDYEGTNRSGIFASVTDGKEQIAPGDSMIYVLSIRQQRDDLRDIDVSLHVPPQVDLISADNAGIIRNGSVIWRKTTVQRGFPTMLSVQARVKRNTPNGQLLISRMTAGTAEAIDTTQTKAVTMPPLATKFRVSITDDRDFVQLREELLYRITVKNTSDASNTTDVRLTLSPFLTLVTHTPTTDRGFDRLDWRGVTFAPFEEKTFTVRTRIDDRPTDYVPIRMRVTAGGRNAVDQTIIKRGTVPHTMGVSINDGMEAVEVGDLVTYTVHVRNKDVIPALGVFVTGSLPTFGEFVEATEGGTWDGKNVRWRLLMVAPDDTREIQYTVRVRSDAPLGATLLASAKADGAEDSDTTAVESVRRAGRGDIRQKPPKRPTWRENVLFRKIADQSEVVPGGRVRYTIAVRNTLDHVIRDAVVTDEFDPSAFSVMTDGDATRTGQGMLEWRVPVLEPGETWETSYTLTVAGRVPHGRVLQNFARISGRDIADVRLTERVRVTSTGVITDLPTTGAAMDTILGVLSSILALCPAWLQRRRVA